MKSSGMPLKNGHLVEQALRRAFGARAVVALDVDDERVVELAQSLDAHRSRGPSGSRSATARRRRPPSCARQTFLWSASSESQAGISFEPRGQLRVRRHDAELLLPGERFFADLVPALVELPLELGDPLLRRVVRRVRGAGGVVGDTTACPARPRAACGCGRWRGRPGPCRRSNSSGRGAARWAWCPRRGRGATGSCRRR